MVWSVWCGLRLPLCKLHMAVPCVPTCAGADEFTSHTEQEEMRKIEKQLKNRFPVGSMVSEQRIVQDFLQQVAHMLCAYGTVHRKHYAIRKWLWLLSFKG